MQNPDKIEQSDNESTIYQMQSISVAEYSQNRTNPAI